MSSVIPLSGWTRGDRRFPEFWSTPLSPFIGEAMPEGETLAFPQWGLPHRGGQHLDLCPGPCFSPEL